MNNNKKIALTILICFTPFIDAANEVPEQPTQIFGDYVWHQSYQDQIVNNQVVVQGRVTHLQKRYEQIKKVASKYNRPITVLDIGAAQGYHMFRLAHDFKDSVCVMIEEDRYLQRLCQLNTNLNNIVFLQKRVTIEELQRLGECEHFDIVLALNVIHWSEENWQDMTDAILNLGDRVIIETPPAGDKAIGAPYLGDIEKHIESKGGKIILQTPRHTQTGLLANMYLVTHNKNYIDRASWFDAPHKYAYKVKSTLKEKQLIKRVTCEGKKDIIERPWKPGINLLTFKMLNGVYPTVSVLQQNLLNLDGKDLWYKEPLMSNFIIQGNAILPIDATLPCAQITNDFNVVLHYITQLLAMKIDQVVSLESVAK